MPKNKTFTRSLLRIKSHERSTLQPLDLLQTHRGWTDYATESEHNFIVHVFACGCRNFHIKRLPRVLDMDFIYNWVPQSTILSFLLFFWGRVPLLK